MAAMLSQNLKPTRRQALMELLKVADARKDTDLLLCERAWLRNQGRLVTQLSECVLDAIGIGDP